MSNRVAIHGMGRIGRLVFRRIIETGCADLVAVNATVDTTELHHLIKYDSVHGTWDVPMEVYPGGLMVAGKFIQVFSTRNPEELPWGELHVDVVVEATGKYRTREGLATHLIQGAKSVILTAPAKSPVDVDLTVVPGVNEEHLTGTEKLISAASCTTNCVAPIVNVLDREFGFESAAVTTVHAYTSDQRLHDGPHKDLRRARGALQSMVPTTTGAGQQLETLFPHLVGRIHAVSVRVPVVNVSLISSTFTVKRGTTREDVLTTFRSYAETSMKGILHVSDEPLVSTDFIHSPYSSIVDSEFLQVSSGKTIQLLAWYDNEWGYSCRVANLVTTMCQEKSAPAQQKVSVVS